LSLRRILVLVHDENRLKFAAFSTAYPDERHGTRIASRNDGEVV
jgi:hypothetical protein